MRNTQVREMIRNLTQSLSDPTQKKVRVNLNKMFSKLALNVSGLMVAGKIFDDHIEDIFRPSGLLSLCDFVPFLRWIGYDGYERNLKESQRKRDAFLQGLIDEFRRDKDSRKMGSEGNTVLEAFMDLQAAEPHVYADDVVKGMLVVRGSLLFVTPF